MKKIICVLLTFFILSSAAHFSTSAKTRVVKGGFNYSYAKKVHKIINKHRSRAGLKALKLDDKLTDEAMLRAAELRVRYSHTRPNGKFCGTAYSWSQTAGENISYGAFSPEEVMKGWIKSSGHRENILRKDYTRVGVGCFLDSGGQVYWVQAFSAGKTSKICKDKGTKYVDVKISTKGKAKSHAKTIRDVCKIKSVKLKKTKFIYSGSAPKYSVIVKDAKGRSIPKKYYKVSCPEKVRGVGEYNVCVNSVYTQQEFTVKFRVVPRTPTISSVTASAYGYKASWGSVPGNGNFELEYCDKKSFSGCKVMIVKGQSFEMSSLVKGREYYVRVRAYDVGDIGCVYSDWSKVYTFTA